MKKLLLLGAALMIAAAPAFAATPSAPVKSANTHIVQAAEKTAVKKHVKKHSKKKSGKKTKKTSGKKSAAAVKPAPDAGNTSAGENLPPVTDTSAGPQ